MANYIETTNINPRRFVTVSSRYVESPVIYYTENKLLTFPTYKKQQYPELVGINIMLCHREENIDQI